MQETHQMQVGSLGGEDPFQEEMATYSSVLAWRIPWTEEPGGLQSMGSQRVRDVWTHTKTHTHTHTPLWAHTKTHTHTHTHTYTHTHPSPIMKHATMLCCLVISWGHKESDMYEHIQRHTHTHTHTHTPLSHHEACYCVMLSGNI